MKFIVFILWRIFHNNCFYSGSMSIYPMDSSRHFTPNQQDGSILCWTTLDPMMVKDSRSSMMDRNWRVAQARVLRHWQLEMVRLLWEDGIQTVTLVTQACRLMSWSILMLHSQILMFSQSTTQHNGNYINSVPLNSIETYYSNIRGIILYPNFLIEVLLKV